MPADVGFQQFLNRNKVGKRSVLFRDSLGVRGEDQRRNIPPQLSDSLQNPGKAVGIIRLREEQVDRILRNLFRELTIRQALYKVCDVAATDKILF